MKALKRFLARLSGLTTRRSDEQRVQEEIAEHLEQQTRANIRVGMTAEEARRQAVLKFGAVERIKDEYRDERGLPFLENLAKDVRYGLRVLRAHSGFTVAAVLTLALGIGANTAIFSIVNAVLLRPLPFEEPELLVRLYTKTAGGRNFELSPGKFYDWQRDAQSFEAMAIYSCCGFRDLALTGRGNARVVKATAVSAGFFDVVSTRPILGRVFREEDDTPGGNRVVIVSHGFWRSELGGDRNAIGRVLKLNDTAYTIIGVMPVTAAVSSWTAMAGDVWIPLGLTETQRAARGNHNLDGVARLKRGVDLAVAQAEMRTIAARLAREFPASDGRWGIVVIPMQEVIVGDQRAMLLMLLAAVGLVLLIACANVGNLLFTRALSRRKEIAIRSALGAGRWRVCQQLLTEALLLAAAGGGLGLLFAYGALTSASTWLSDQVPRAEEISMDARVLLFALAVSILTGVLAGVLPALRAGQSDPNDALKEGGRGDSALGMRTRRLLVVGEVALSVVLLMSAGVMVQSLLALRHGDSGFEANNVLTMKVTLVQPRYRTPEQRAAFFDAALSRIRALPGVEAAGTIDDLPFADGSAQTLQLEGDTAQRDPVAVQVRQISTGYLDAMGIPVLRGRDVGEGDGEVMLISRDVARMYWGTGDPIGRRVALPSSPTVLREVVGIVGDIKQRSLVEASTPTAYFYTRGPYGRKTFALRTSVPPDTLVGTAAAAIRAIDPEQPVGDIRTMTQAIDEELTSQRVSAFLLMLFAGVALFLAALGIYSVLSYIVRGRGREIGIRAVLGAQHADVLRLVILEAMAPTLVGIVAGAIAALASAKVLQTLVFGVSASDPLTLAGVGVALLLVALTASFVPAYRAVRLDPVKVLRAD